MKTTLLLLILSISLFAGDSEQSAKLLNNVNKNFFIENKGQWPKEVRYLARVGGMNCWITNSGVVYDYFKIIRNGDEKGLMKMLPDKRDEFERENRNIQGHVVKMNLLDVNENSIKRGNDKKEGYCNYFIGNDKSKWASFVPLYGDIEVDKIYPGINVKYYFDGNNIRYDYKVKPGGDLSKIRLRFEGQESLIINDKGELVIKTSLGEVTNGKLYSYQKIDGVKKEVSCSFQKNNDGTISFNASNYDRQKELIIDPLIYSTYLGGNDSDFGCSIVLDSVGNSYLTGWTRSINFPLIQGAYQSTFGGSCDVFVTKLNSTENGLLYSTYLGGSNSDEGVSIVLNSEGSVYLTGWTGSYNFPVTQGAYQTTFGGGSGDAFVTKLNSTGSGLIYSTYLGSSYFDLGNSIALDSDVNAYITGLTESIDFPVSQGAYQTTHDGEEDAFVTKLNSTGTGLIYSTFLGGNIDDCGNSIALDSERNAFIAGYTSSNNFPITQGAYQTTYGGGDYLNDAFVTKLNSTGSGLIYSTFLGGNDRESGKSIVVDLEHNAYVTGYVGSNNFPVTQGAYQIIFGGIIDAFVTKLNATGSGLIYSTYLGGYGADVGYSIVLDSEYKVYITGGTSSFNFPVTIGAFQTTFGSGYYDAFVSKLNSTGSELIYSTYLGGNYYDYGYSIDLDSEGNAYLTGPTESANFPITQGAYQTIYNSNCDAFLTKLSLAPNVSVEDEQDLIPKEYKLEQNYPNPFNPSTVIRYSLPTASSVTLFIYNTIGETVRQLNLGIKQAGVNKFTFNAAGLSSGVYFYSIKAASSEGNTHQNLFKKMIVLK